MGQVRMTATGFERDGKPFVPWGANYFRPGTGWPPQLWKAFEVDSAREDFSRMRAAGVNVVRVFGTWMSFLESETKVNEEGFQKFDAMLRIADEHGILLHPTGPDHWEGQPVGLPRDGNFALNETMLRAGETYWREMARRYKNDERIFAYDVKNEPSIRPDQVFWQAWESIAAAKNDPVGWPSYFTRRSEGMRDEAVLEARRLANRFGNTWLQRMSDAMRTGGNSTLVTCGFLQNTFPFVLGDCGFHLRGASEPLDFISIHFYPGTIGRSTDYRWELDHGTLWASYAASFGKPVIFGELGWLGGNTRPFISAGGGVSYPPSTEEQSALWCRDLVMATRPYACGWLNWGTYDVPESLDCTRHSGMFASDGRIKEWGRLFQAMVPTVAASRVATDLPVVEFDPTPLLTGKADLYAELECLAFRLRSQGDFLLKEA